MIVTLPVLKYAASLPTYAQLIGGFFVYSYNTTVFSTDFSAICSNKDVISLSHSDLTKAH